MNRLVAILGGLVALPCEQGATRYFEAVGAVEVLPDGFEPVNEVLRMRGIELSEHERVTVARAIVEESKQAGYDPFLVLGLIDVESDFRPSAVSGADARGLMQIQPVTLGWLVLREQWELSVEEVQRDPALQVRLGVRYLRYLHDRFGSLDAALMAYNVGPTRYGVVSLEPHGLDPYFGYARAVRRDAAALRERSEPAASVAIRGNGAKPPVTADGIWGG